MTDPCLTLESQDREDYLLLTVSGQCLSLQETRAISAELTQRIGDAAGKVILFDARSLTMTTGPFLAELKLAAFRHEAGGGSLRCIGRETDAQMSTLMAFGPPPVALFECYPTLEAAIACDPDADWGRLPGKVERATLEQRPKGEARVLVVEGSLFGRRALEETILSPLEDALGDEVPRVVYDAGKVRRASDTAIELLTAYSKALSARGGGLHVVNGSKLGRALARRGFSTVEAALRAFHEA